MFQTIGGGCSGFRHLGERSGEHRSVLLPDCVQIPGQFASEDKFHFLVALSSCGDPLVGPYGISRTAAGMGSTLIRGKVFVYRGLNATEYNKRVQFPDAVK